MTLIPTDMIDKDAILRSLNLNPRDPKTQALLLVCDRYHLDPLLRHLILIQGNAYVTRDGYLAIAHRSGQFDGMEVLGEGETNTHFWARVAVWRRDMTHPFTYTGRYPKAKGGVGKDYGPEMAIKCAEVMGLRRAFNVTGVGAADERWDAPDVQYTQESDPVPPPLPRSSEPPPAPSSLPPCDTDPDDPLIIAGDAARDQVVAGIAQRINNLKQEMQDVYGLQRKSLSLPSVTRPELWHPHHVEQANRLIDELEQDPERPFTDRGGGHGSD